jgi:hypothetical protein
MKATERGHMLKRFTIMYAIVAGLAAAAAGTVAASPQHPSEAAAAPAKLTICHKAGSGWRRLSVARSAFTKPGTSQGRMLRAHLAHVGDAIVAGTGACPSLSATPAPTTASATRVTICHRTGSASNPYRRITVSSRSIANPNSSSSRLMRGHMAHVGDLLLPGAAACPRGTPPPSQPVRLEADLQAVTGASGTGTFEVTIRLSRLELCYELRITGVANVTAAHIHRVSDASIVVPLTAPTTGSSEGCVTVQQPLLGEIASTPGAFYVNVHTQSHPNGQVQGTLRER